MLHKSLPMGLLFGVLLASNAVSADSQQGWTMEREKQGVRVYTRSIEGSPFLEVKAVTLISAPIDEIVIAMGDGNNCPQWQKLCKSSTVLETVSARENYVHTVLDLPWPMSDRDLVNHSRTLDDAQAGTVTIEFTPAPSYYPEQDYVRAESVGRYIFKSLADGQVEFTWINHIDMGGDFSPAVLNGRLANSTLKDVKSLLGLFAQ